MIRSRTADRCQGVGAIQRDGSPVKILVVPTHEGSR
jgi:hypothetical protein